MPAKKSAKAAAPKRVTKARTTKSANHTKTTHNTPATAAEAPDSFLDRVVEQAKGIPAQAGQALEMVGDVATATAKQTGSIVSDIAQKVGLGTTKKTPSRSTRRSRRK